jgi:Fe-S cluster assembly protein SufD
MHLIPLKPSIIPILCQGQETVVRIPDGANIIDSPIDLILVPSDRDLPVSLKIYAGKWSLSTVIVRMERETRNKSLEFKQTLIAELGAGVKIIEFQNLPTDTNFRAVRETKAKEYACIEHIIIQTGGLKTDNQLNLSAGGSNCELNSNLLLLARGNQKHHFLLNNNFVHKDGRGEANVRSIASDDGVIDTRGTINVGAKAKGTESHLHLDSLLLSRTASITAIPALEINTNDVKVGHGASVSNLNEENLFYLTSRGLDPDEARRLMVRGFVAGVTDRLNDLPELRDRILELI